MFRAKFAAAAVSLLACLALLPRGSASASTVTAEVIIDLNTAVVAGSFNQGSAPLANPITVNDGDTVEFHIGFAPGQALAWSGNGNFTPWFVTGGGTGDIALSDLTVDLLGLSQGTQISPASIANAGLGGCCAHLGPNSIDGENVLRTFSGVIVSYIATFPTGDTVRNYGALWPNTMFGGTVAVASVATTPIPAALPLFAAALAGLGAAGWRRQRLHDQRRWRLTG